MFVICLVAPTIVTLVPPSHTHNHFFVKNASKRIVALLFSLEQAAGVAVSEHEAAVEWVVSRSGGSCV